MPAIERVCTTTRRGVIVYFVIIIVDVCRAVTQCRAALVSLPAVVGRPSVQKYVAPTPTSGDVIVSACAATAAAGANRQRSTAEQQVQPVHQQSATDCQRRY